MWLGLEGKDSQYGKLNGTDTRQLVRDLQDHGIRVLGSSIIGLEEHTPENIDEAIAHAVSHDTDFHQFMLYTPVAGTPLHAEHMAARHDARGRRDRRRKTRTGSSASTSATPHIRDGQETEYLLRAFEEDFRVNGPSVLRIVRTTLKGWRRYRNHPERGSASGSPGRSGACRSPSPERSGRPSDGSARTTPLVKKLDGLLRELYREFGLKSRLAAPIVGRILTGKLRREARRLESGWTYEPPTFYERNYEEAGSAVKATVLQWVPGLALAAAAVST